MQCKMPSKIPKDWWRKRWEYNLEQRAYLNCYLHGRRRKPLAFVGSERWTVCIVGNGLYASRPTRSILGLGGVDANKKGELVGRIHGKYLVIHAKRAPRWLKNWAIWQEDTYLLPKLDRGTLASHLMQEKLRGAR